MPNTLGFPANGTDGLISTTDLFPRVNEAAIGFQRKGLSSEEESKWIYGDDIYTVDRILAKRYFRARVEYLIKWHGQSKSQATWEPTHNIFDPSVIEDFESK